MATINYENKEAINVNPTIPNKNKVVDSDMNLIKQVGNQILTTMGVYTDDWDEEGTYLIDDIVIYDNRIFKNLTGTNTTTPPTEDTTNWLEVSIRDISGGAEIPIQDTAPANPREDDLWIDTSEPEEMQEAIVNEYSESTNKTYSCDYVNKLETYSTTEQRVGTWIDGKPIYRVCKNVGNLPDNGRIEIDFEGIIPQNVFVTKIYGIAERITQSTPTNVLDYVDLQFLTTLLMYRSNNYKLYIDTNQNQTAYTGIIVIEYIKATD